MPRYSAAGHALPHARIASISGTTPSTFITLTESNYLARFLLTHEGASRR